MRGEELVVTASAAPVTTPSPTTQEIRLAVVLNGGVSLAVWISGVTHELNQLVQASRRRMRKDTSRDTYADLLNVLEADARIDVIAGTSAGGINGGFLALGLVHGCDLSGLRTLWQDQGDLGTLLRDPRHPDQPSLLRGDYFHEQLTKAYGQVWEERPGEPATSGEDVDLFLTGTLWEGRRSFFADDMGRRITELDHDATFHFTSDPETVSATDDSTDPGDLCSPAVTTQLGRASRCTASFPGAFEPCFVTIPTAQETVQLPDGRWTSDAGRANFQRSQFVIDGGILRNKPIRPAIDAIYRQAAGEQVRRILAYVVPDPGEAATGPGTSTVTAVPDAVAVMLGVMTRLRSTDSVADELAEIDRRNQDTANRRGARDRLAQMLLDAVGSDTGPTDLVRSAYAGYLEVRRDDSAQSVARLLLSAPGQPPWSQREVAAELLDLARDRDDLPFLPQEDPDSALQAPTAEWRWGQATVRRLGDVVLDVLKRAVWLAPLTDERRTTIVEQRAATHEILRHLRGDRLLLDAYWRTMALPARSSKPVATKDELDLLKENLGTKAEGWATTGGLIDMTVTLKDRAVALAACLVAAGPVLQSISTTGHPTLDKGDAERDRLRALVEFLVPDGASADDVLQNLLRLEVVHVAFTGVTDLPEQAVELVQVSSLRKDLITGIQLHHFGAFYRASWRANDWLRGRIDGAQQLVQMLLAPERLRQLGLSGAEAVERLKAVAVGGPGTPGHDELDAAWNDVADKLVTELQVIEGDDPLPRTFPLTAERIAHRLCVDLLPKELAALAAAVTGEPDPVPLGVQWAEPTRTVLQRQGARPGPAELDGLLAGSSVVGRQTIAQEAEEGSDTFARTVSHASAAATATASALTKPKAVTGLFKALRGYALMLWVLGNFLARKSHTGRNLTSLVLGAGCALVALAVVVPGIPMVVPLVGVVLVLAVASIAALQEGGSPLNWRLGLVAAVALAALVGLGVWKLVENKHGVWDTLMSWALRLFLVVVVLGVGWILGRPSQKNT
jgi:patatin-related protein